jgi:hypothetical protein
MDWEKTKREVLAVFDEPWASESMKSACHDFIGRCIEAYEKHREERSASNENP